jgi:hypothetical protein
VENSSCQPKEGISLFCWERNLGPVGEFLGMLYCKINDFLKITQNSKFYMKKPDFYT